MTARVDFQLKDCWYHNEVAETNLVVEFSSGEFKDANPECKVVMHFTPETLDEAIATLTEMKGYLAHEGELFDE